MQVPLGEARLVHVLVPSGKFALKPNDPSRDLKDPAVTKADDDERQPMRLHVNTVTLLPGRMHCSFAVPLDLTLRIS